MKLPVVTVIVLLINYNSTPIRREIVVSKIIYFGNSGILFWQEFREFYFGKDREFYSGRKFGNSILAENR